MFLISFVINCLPIKVHSLLPFFLYGIGAYMDGFIPDKAPDKLQTLAFQAQELYKRETIKDYTRLRHRLLKYNSTVRMV